MDRIGTTSSSWIVAWELGPIDSARTYEIEWGSAHGGSDLDHFYYPFKPTELLFIVGLDNIQSSSYGTCREFEEMKL